MSLNLALFFGAILLAAALIKLGRLREFHHGYLGVALGLLGGARELEWLQLVGQVLTWDDTLQHVIQALRRPTSRVSLLYWLYAPTLARLPIVQRLNAWLDERSGPTRAAQILLSIASCAVLGAWVLRLQEPAVVIVELTVDGREYTEMGRVPVIAGGLSVRGYDAATGQPLLIRVRWPVPQRCLPRAAE